MPDELVPSALFGDMEAYLVELRSLGGLSGSPVFVWSTGLRFAAPGKPPAMSTVFRLLGLVHGHWDAPVDSGVAGEWLRPDRLNLGMAMVVPARRILEVLDHPKLVERRRIAEADIAKRGP